MPVGKNDVSIHVGTQKAPEFAPPGLLLRYYEHISSLCLLAL